MSEQLEGGCCACGTLRPATAGGPLAAAPRVSGCTSDTRQTRACVAMMSEKERRKASSLTKLSGDSSTKELVTESFSSLSSAATQAAREPPRAEASTRKLHVVLGTWRAGQQTAHLFARSSFVTVALSTTVKEAMPPSTRFLRHSLPVGPQCSRQTLALSRRAWPTSPQIRSCLGGGED